MTFAKGYYDSIYGRINSEWKWENGKWSYKATVPPNTSAMLYLSAESVSQIKEGGKPIGTWKGLQQANGVVIVPLTSGTYSFEVKNK
jgi:alpha-L-rhamnosidase